MSAPTAAAPSGVAEVNVGRPGLDHVPALDGIRALAVLAVLFFHGQMPWAIGGFLGVSVFFTLSGFLITSLLIREHGHAGSVDLLRFWGRRFRRLAPASLALLLVLLAVGWGAGISERVVDDIRAAALYVANWWAIHTGASYADVFASPSPTEHFWSLAIEEQFYALFPVVVWLTLRRASPSRTVIRLGVVLGSMWVGSVALGFVLSNPDHIYLGTTTRAAELLTGALLALWWPIRGRTDRSLRPLGSAAGIAALAVLAVLCWRTAVTSSWLYQGGLPAVSLVSATLVAVATRPGPLSRVLSCRPLVHLGAISYGVYLFHWPIFMWLDQRRTGWELGPLLILRLVVTVALAELSFHVLERPIRLKKLLPGRSAVAAFAIAMAALFIISAVVPTETDDREALASILDGDSETQLGLTSPTEPSAAPRPSRPDVTAPPTVTTTTVPPPPVIAFAGDSVPAVLASEIGSLGLDEFGVQILNLGIEGCDGARG
ncbi:MAG TPA: acyltransferase, partial [Microthrixaceae bacterium]|nr:acyltransferase [Microthrixaceae bacterium]